MSILTGTCKHCGKTRGEHYGDHFRCSKNNPQWFEDAGQDKLDALDAHKEELYEASKRLSEGFQSEKDWNKLYRILNQIEKER